MGIWLFQEWMLTHSCNANSRPSNVNAPTKTTGCRKRGTARPLIVGNKFSCEPCAFYVRTVLPHIRSPREEPIDLRRIRLTHWPAQRWGNHGLRILLYRRRQEQESDARTIHLRQKFVSERPQRLFW